MIRAILVPNIAEGIAKGLFGAAFVALLLFLVIVLMRHRAGNALVTQESKSPGGSKMSSTKLKRTIVTAIIAMALADGSATAQKKFDTGATDTEIKIGNTMPYSGPASAYGVVGRTEEAYFKKINAEGGINGRKINFISYDDAYSPPKAVEQVRKLVESDEVLLIFSSLGTPSNSSPLARQSGATRRNSLGLWAGSQAIRAKRESTPNSC